MYSVTIRNLAKTFDRTTVLDGISLDIKAGEFFFLLGPSGCGKTTLLRILAGFEKPDGGEVLFDGADVSRMPPQERNASMVFQSYALWPHMTVAQNVAYGLENRGVGGADLKKKVGRALELVRLGGFDNRFPSQLSGGQQQRVALARALVVGPRLLLLDEPLSNLDARLRADMRVELAALHRETGVTTVYVTHDQEEALSLAGRIAYIDKGKLVQVGTPRQLYRTPVTAAAARFLGNANIIYATVRERRDRLLTADTPFGLMKGLAAGGANFEPGSRAYCFIRPERLMPGVNADNSVRGTVLSVLYTGGREHLRLDCGGTVFEAHVGAPNDPTAPGSSMVFGLPVEDVLFLAE